MICASRLADTIPLPGRSAGGTVLRTEVPFRLKVFSAVRTDLNGRLIIRLPLFQPFLIMVQLPAAFSAKPPPAPGFAALLDWRPVFRAFVDRRVRAVTLRFVVPHPAFAAGEFLPRNVAGWNKALPAVQACQLIRHDAFPPRVFFPFYHTGKGSRLFDAYRTRRLIQEGATLEKVLPEVRTMEPSALED